MTVTQRGSLQGAGGGGHWEQLVGCTEVLLGRSSHSGSGRPHVFGGGRGKWLAWVRAGRMPASPACHARGAAAGGAAAKGLCV